MFTGQLAELGGSVLALDREVRPADRAGQLRLLRCELELLGELLRDVHPLGELEADSSPLGIVDVVHHIDGQAAVVTRNWFGDAAMWSAGAQKHRAFFSVLVAT